MSDKGVSRRDFLVSTGAFDAGVDKSGEGQAASCPVINTPSLSWPYETLNPQTTSEEAYYKYFTGGCMYATGAALINALITAAGTPWNTFNPELFRYSSNRISAWNTVCGAINAACAIIQLVNPTEAPQMINELFDWYDENPFPSSRFDAIARYAANQPQTVSHSPLCHQSSKTWANTTGNGINSKYRKDRCAKLSGDVTYKTIEMLNAWKTGTWIPAYTTPDIQSEISFERCFSCHVVTISE